MKQYKISFESYLLTQKRVSRNTLESYMSDIEQLSNFIIGKGISLEDLKVENLTDFFKFLRLKKEISARTLSRKISSIKVFYSFLELKFGIKDITETLVFPKLEKNLPNFMTTSEVETLLECTMLDKSLCGIRNNALIRLMYATGIRVSECVNLLISSVKFEENLILVYGKGRKERLVPVPGQLIDLLRNFIKEYHSKILGTKHNTDYLFPVKHRGKIKPMTRQAGWLIVKQLIAKSGIKKRVTPHTLRHSLATHMLEQGANLRSLQVWLGHENLSTVEIYTHINTDRLLKIYDKKHPRS